MKCQNNSALSKAERTNEDIKANHFRLFIKALSDLDRLSHSDIFENPVSHVLGGVCSSTNYIAAYEKSQ